MRQYALKLKLLALLTMTLSMVSFVAVSSAQDTSCDPELWDAIKNRAFLEVQREIAQNQNLIFKPDSTLELTCLPDQISLIGLHWDVPAVPSMHRPFSVSDAFKGNYQWDPDTIPEPGLPHEGVKTGVIPSKFIEMHPPVRHNPPFGPWPPPPDWPYTLAPITGAYTGEDGIANDITDISNGFPYYENVAPRTVPPTFFHTQRTGSFENTLLDSIFIAVVRNMHGYLNANFTHNYVNERYTGSRRGINYQRDMDGRAGGGAGNQFFFNAVINCNEMARVWRDAKCLDFQNADQTDKLGDLNEDMFYDFPWYVSKDPRRRPAYLGQCQPHSEMQKTIHEAWDTRLPNSTVKVHKEQFHTITIRDDEDAWLNTTPFREEGYETFMDKVLAPDPVDKRTRDCRASHKVPTGVIVIRDLTKPPQGANTYLECICTNASCTYIPGTSETNCDGRCG